MPGKSSCARILDGLTRSDLATSLPAYLDDGRWPSRLLAQFVNNNAALTYLPLLNVLPPVTINGMAYAIRGTTLDSLGGFGPVMRAVTDDLAVARQVIAGGGRLCQTASPVWVQTTVRDGRQYLRQMHRWFVFARLLLRLQPPALQAVIALLYATPPVLLWSVVAAAAWWPSGSSVFSLMVLLILRAGVLVALQRRIYGRPLHRPAYSVGTQLHWRKEAVAAAVRRAACELPEVEFHISDGNRSSDRRESDGNVHRIGFVSYARDLPRYDLVVHHGGAGVLSHTLAAGAPALVLPVDYDQFDNAARAVGGS